MSKGFVPVYLLVGILVSVLIAGGIYYFAVGKNALPAPFKNSPKACTEEAKQCPDGSYVGREGPNCEFKPCLTVKPISSSDELTTWKTYEDGITFKYPGTWIMGEKEILGSRSEQLFRSSDGNYVLNLTIQGNYNNLTGKPFSSLSEFASYWPDLKDYVTIILDTQTAHKVKNYFFDSSGNGAWKYDVYFFSKDTKIIYRLSLSTDKDTKIAENGSNIFDQILSTFKFLDQGQAKVDSKSCLQDSDCTLLLCGGCFSKEWVKTAPPDLPCANYYGYKCECRESKCIEII